MTVPASTPTSITEPTNAAILTIAEDQLAGFHADPFAEISARSGVPKEIVHARLAAMLAAGTVRRIRQTLLATNLAEGALVAWKIGPERLNAAFETLFADDPFSGHVVVRSTDGETPGSGFRLWTTLKVPQGYSLEKHARHWAERIGADDFRLMSAKRLFTLGVGHLRRRTVEIGAKTDEPGAVLDTQIVSLSDLDWQVLTHLKRELTAEEIGPDLWATRAAAVGIPLATFLDTARSLNERGVVGRFSAFLEHVKPAADGERATRYNALFHWRVPVGRELEAGQEIGRFHCMTHAYWREGGPDFADVNLMGVAHGLEKERVLANKAAIDAHLEALGIPVLYTNVFWGGRSEIKPSEIAPDAYVAWCESVGIDPEAMRT